MPTDRTPQEEELDQLLERKENETSALRKIIAYMLEGKVPDSGDSQESDVDKH